MRQMHRYDGGRTLPLVEASKVTTGQLAALEMAREPRTVCGIASGLGLSRPATSQIVERLVQARLVQRKENRRDRRQRSVALTAKGRALLEGIAEARAGRFEDALAVLSAPLAGRFAAVLEEVVETLDRRGGDQ